MVDKVWQGYHPGKIFASSLPNSLHKSYHVSFLEDIVQREAQQGSTNHIIDIDIELAIMFLFPISNMSYSENMNDSISRTWVIHLPASTSQTLKLFPWTIYPGMITCHYLYGIHGIKMCPFYNLKLSFLNIYIYTYYVMSIICWRGQSLMTFLNQKNDATMSGHLARAVMGDCPIANSDKCCSHSERDLAWEGIRRTG